MKPGNHMPDAQDFFGQMFKEDKGPKKTKSVIHPIKCTLENLYQGKTSRIKVNRDRLCSKCNGKGGEESASRKCEICVGKGKILRT